MTRPPGDLAYAYVGWFLLAFVPVVGVAEAWAPGLASGRSPFLVAGLLALPLAVGHWYAGWSVGPLGATVFWAAALSLAVGLPLSFLDAFVTSGWLDSPAVRLGLLAAVYAGAAALATRP